MAKKKSAKKSAKKKTVKRKPVDRTITPEQYLEILIGFSRRAITNQGSGVDEFFTQQAVRLEKRLEELRKAK